MEKAFSVSSLKTLGEVGSGKFEAIVSVFGNVDKVKDRVLPQAFDRALKEQEPPPVVWSHFWSIPPIGETLDWDKGEKGLHVQGALFVGADDKHQYADMVYTAMKSRQGRPPALREFSFAYEVGAEEKKTEEVDGVETTINDLKEIFPVHEVGPCLRGCNPATELVAAPKSLNAEGFKRLERLALKLGKTVNELLAEIEEEYDSEDAVQPAKYPRALADLRLA